MATTIALAVVGALHWTCPACGCEPAEPTRLEGSFWCAGCIDHCQICGHPALKGEKTCTACAVPRAS
jgi:hypothetical protein